MGGSPADPDVWPLVGGGGAGRTGLKLEVSEIFNSS